MPRSNPSNSNSVISNLQIVFVLSTALLVLSITSAIYSIRKLVDSSKMVNHTNEVLLVSENLISFIKDAEASQRGFLLTHDEAFLETYNEAKKKSLQASEHLYTLTNDNDLQRNNLSELKPLINTRFAHMQNVVQKAGRSSLRSQIDSALIYGDILQGKALMDEIREITTRIKNEEKRLLNIRTSELDTYTGFTPLLVIVASFISILITIFSYLKIRKELGDRIRKQQEDEEKYLETNRRISTMEGITRKISSGDYTTRSLDDTEDELGRISVALNNMVTSLESNFNLLKNRNWMQEGTVKIGDAMRGERDIHLLASNLLGCVTQYVNAPAATLYIQEAGIFRLFSGHAALNAPGQFHLGEGLIGETARDRRIRIVDDLPHEFLIGSSLGQTSAVSLVIVPLVHERETIAVIELGFHRKPEPLEIDFLRDISETIAMGIHSALSYIRLQNLLEETQAQTEELQAQQNELENLNSELEAQSQKLQASEEELRVQQEELQQTNEELEERSVLLEEKNQEIQRKARELETTTRYKSEFLANMSHELRTPLNSILLLSRLLSENSEKNLSNDQIEYAKVIQSSGNGLLGLIDEILDLSKIEAGKMELEYLDVSLNEIAEDMRNLFKEVAREKKLDFKVHISPDLPYSIQTDKSRVEQILKNLLSNALKFTSAGSVSLEIKKCMVNNSKVCFVVKDTGIGIPQDKQQFIFEAFQQADGSTRRKYGGTGLGLSISRELSKLLGGDIFVNSVPKQGSEFTLRVPSSKPEYDPYQEDSDYELPEPENVRRQAQFDNYIASNIPESVPDDRNKLTEKDKVILIVEDDTAFARSLIEVSHKNGYKVVSTVRGDEAYPLAKRYKPAGILLDIQLPVKSGWEVIDELKNDLETRHIPVHMMSSYKVKNESLLKGAIDFINKPMVFEQIPGIFQKIEYVLNRSSKKVLIIEDNPKHAKALAYYLETYNINSEIKNNVPESVEALKQEGIDCVIMDMGIPDDSSYQILEKAKQEAEFENLPIIIFTGKSLSMTEEQRIKKYADSIVVKTAHSYQRMLDEVSLFLHLVDGKHRPDARRNSHKKLGVLTEILHGKTVLIVDDDVRNIFSLSKSLEKLNMNVITAINGKEAIQKLSEHEEIDIVLLDMMMPEMDGYETARVIRNNNQWKNLPVIALTAKAMSGDREKCISAGSSDYITKPVDIDQLLSLLRVWLYENYV
jgi:signal transduction histidine kinase/DNA-binding response OmpR family regulator/CHASE3 domain sensor protein